MGTDPNCTCISKYFFVILSRDNWGLSPFVLFCAGEGEGVVYGVGEFLGVVSYYDEGLLRIGAEGLYYLHYQGAAPTIKSVERFVKDE